MTATAQQIEIPAGFVVVSFQRDGATYRPTLDYMHEFESYGHMLTVFNPTTGEDRSMSVAYRDWRDSLATVDTAARDQWEAMVKERAEWRGWILGMIKANEEAEQCPAGSVVEVYKGRKVPKGVYTVVERFTTAYGPTAHLKDAKGVVTRYISPDNFRRHDLKNVRRQRVLDNCPAGVGETVWAFLFADSPTGEFSPEKLPFLCDYIEDGRAEGIPSEAGRWIRERFCK